MKVGSLPVSKLIQSMLVFYLIAWTISPPLQIDMVFRVAALGAAIFWFILDIPNNVKYERIHTFALLFLLLVVVVTLFQYEGKLSEVLKPINYYMLVLAFLMAYCYKDRWNELTPLIPIVLLLFAYFNFQSAQAVIEDPAIARLIVRDDPEVYQYMRSGVGGYNLLYPQVCVLPALVLWLTKVFRKNKIKFAIGVIWIVSFAYFLLNSGYSIAVVASLAGLILLFFYKRKSVVMAVVITAILVVLLVYLIGYNDGFRNALLEFFDGTTVAKKINDIYLSITTEDTADSIMVRMNAYSNSIVGILSYPIIGGLWWGDGGGHSALLDTIAKYGVFGGYIFVKMVFELPMRIKRESDNKKDIQLANALLIAVLIVVLLDSLTYNFIFTLMFMAPMCYSDILKWRTTDEDTLDSKSHTFNSLKRVKRKL